MTAHHDPGRHLWPFGTRAAVLAVPIVLVSLLLLLLMLRFVSGWPSAAAETAVLIGVLLLSLLPLVLVLIGLLVERGAVVEYKGIKLDLSRVAASGGVAAVAVPSNIGVPGRPVNDSSSKEVLAALHEATSHDVIVVDLHEGDAWWETRLLVLLAGAARRSRPNTVVFTGTDANRPGRFLGWATPRALLERLLASSVVYRHIYASAEAAASQWALVEPATAPPGWSGAALPTPAQPPVIQGLAARYYWMAFQQDGLPSPMRFEQLLASELGERVETPQPPRGISLTRLDELFRAVLRKQAIEETDPAEVQVEALFSDEGTYIGVTRDGHYQRLLPRIAAVNAILQQLAARVDAKAE